MAKKRPTGNKPGTTRRAQSGKKRRRGRVNQAVDVLQKSIDKWSKYAVDCSRLASSGDLNPGRWAQSYAKMWQGLADDLGVMMKLMFPKQG